MSLLICWDESLIVSILRKCDRVFEIIIRIYLVFRHVEIHYPCIRKALLWRRLGYRFTWYDWRKSGSCREKSISFRYITLPYSCDRCIRGFGVATIGISLAIFSTYRIDISRTCHFFWFLKKIYMSIIARMQERGWKWEEILYYTHRDHCDDDSRESRIVEKWSFSRRFFLIHRNMGYRYIYDLEKCEKCKFSFLPVYFRLSFWLEIRIRLREWSRSEKSRMSRKWARMRWYDDMMPKSIDEGSLHDRVGTPEDEYYPFSLLWESPDHHIGEYLPSLTFMWCRLPFSDCQDRIQKKYSLPCPVSQISLSASDTEITFEFFEDISEAWLRLRAMWHWERKSHRSSGSMIWILSEDHDSHIIERRRIERSEYILPFWEASSSSIFTFHELSQIRPVRLLELRGECSVPRWVDFYSHFYKYIEKSYFIEKIILTHIFIYVWYRYAYSIIMNKL
jgi:hypothetical protein